MIEQYMKYENTVTGIKYKLFMGFFPHSLYKQSESQIKKKIYNHNIDIKTVIWSLVFTLKSDLYYKKFKKI